MQMLPSGLSETIEDKETLARFLNSSSLFNVAGLIKPAAFMPRDGETSVFRHDGEDDDSLWQIGEEIVPEGRHVHGVAFIQAEEVFSSGLEVEAKEPPPLHANIVGWPDGSDTLTKAQHKELATLLAQQSNLRRKQ